jgi:hypothetical protein
LLPCSSESLSSCLLSKHLKIKIYKTIILPVVLCGCETWSVTLRKEHRLKVFDNRVLRRIFRPKRDEVTRGWRKMYNLCSSSNIIKIIKSRRMGLVGHVVCMGEIRNAYKILVGKCEEKRPLGRPRH